MVSSILPGATGAAALGVDSRFARTNVTPQRREDAALGDRVELTGASLSAAGESVRAGIAQLHEALSAGHDAQALLVQVQGLARNGGSQAELDAALTAYTARVEAALQRGASIVGGQDVAVSAEPGAAPLTISGVDLRLGGDVIAVGADAQIDDPTLAQTAQKSLETLQDAMSKLLDSARALEAHQGFLGAAERVAGVRDMDADGARLLALQVRQGLEAVGAAPIANVEPQAVLSLFRA